MTWRPPVWPGGRARRTAPPDPRTEGPTGPPPAEPDSGTHRRSARDSAHVPPLLLTDPAPVTPQFGDDDCPYLAHFGLSAPPFSLLPDPGFLFWSPSHKRAHAVMEYGLMSRAPLSLVTGEIGAGKTTLVHHLLRGLGTSVRVGLISNASGLRGEMLYWILSALGESPSSEADLAMLFEAFQTCLIDTYASGRRVLLIFDEAQTLGVERMEELRMLTNINTGTDVLLQIMLVGQPELRETVLHPNMRQFAQRVAATFHLPAMKPRVQAAYIEHRLCIAGAQRPIFDAAALETVHRATCGIPRLTNQLCDLAMLYAYSANKLVVDSDCVQHVLDDGVLMGAQPTHGTDAASAAATAMPPR